MDKVYPLVARFVNRYPFTLAWRIRKHCKVLEKHLNPGEEIFYAFAGQKNGSFFSTAVILLTNKRILIGSKRVLFGYFLTSITPEMFNDFKVSNLILWGKVYIDTVKEFITVSGLQKKSLIEVETNFSEYIIKYGSEERIERLRKAHH